jgi:hypothetical protein
MRKLILASILLFTSPVWASCPLIQLTPCQEIRQPSHAGRVVKALIAKYLTQESRLKDLERRLRLAEIIARAQQRQILALHQRMLVSK